ncbi:PREDICTED: acyl-CoA-binding domain-containing protein 4 isoform X2 [Galeopterus variegatus]|uniref:Acyl-CoA-binding domain-containing protein 4 isoform X2 n=1 Tax=Galeopterus variegatus TaxID=482537 RepID=A0ABM0RAX3_GALVR|nr:PREDICTED: acyl-CoA-binding domain-containing protein 4 isoform X2 [Galeopterus variegatus]
MKAQSQIARNNSRLQSASFRTCLRTALTAPRTKRCCDSTATTSRLPWGPAWSPGLGSGTPLDDISGELPTGGQTSLSCQPALSQPSAPRDAWNSLGKMSREEAMTAYITEMKLVAQKVIDTVPLGEVAEDMFDYFEPLYRVIPDMPRPPEAFLRRVTGWKGQVLNGDVQAVPEPPSLPKEPAPPSPESQPPRDLDSEVFCDSLEQLESELQVWTEQSGAPRGESDTRNSPVSSREKGAAAQCSALAPQALRSHAALLLPVALLRPVALPTVSDSEEAPLPGKLGLGPGPGSVVGWEARREARRPGHRGRSEQAPAAGGERRFRSLPSPVARRPPRTLRTSSLKIHLQMNVSLNKRKP